MKKIIIALSSLAALLSCQKSSDFVAAPAGAPREFHATMEGCGTRTALSGTGVIWMENDLVAVFPGFTSAHKYTVKAGMAGSTSTTLEETDYNPGRVLGDNLIYGAEQKPADDVALDANIAYYPYMTVFSRESTIVDGKTYSYSEVPDISVAGGNGSYELSVGFDEEFDMVGMMPMVAVSKDAGDHDLQFRNLFGILRFQLKGNGSIAGIAVQGNNGEVLAGDMKVTCSHGSDPSVVFTDHQSTSKTVAVFDEDMDMTEMPLSMDETFIMDVPLPPITFEKGITVVFITENDGRYNYITRTTTAPLTITRSHIKPMAELDLGSGTNTSILYGTIDDQPVEPKRLSAFDADGNLLSYTNEYNDLFECCVIDFSGTVDKIDISFEGCTNLKYFESVTNKVTLMSADAMFQDCSNLRDAYLLDFNTGEVTSMEAMFDRCGSLETCDVSGFDTHNVTSMRFMFYGCEQLRSLELGGFDTSNVTDMASMFHLCRALGDIDLRGFNTSKVTDMRRMFCGCNCFCSLDVSSFDTSNVTDMNGMFWGVFYYDWTSDPKVLDLTGFETSNVTDMTCMFNECCYLDEIRFGAGFKTPNVTSMFSMFGYCYNLESLDLSGFDTRNVTDMASMFYECRMLEQLNVSSFDTANVTDMYFMFGHIGVESLDVSSFDTGKVTDMFGMFNAEPNLKSLDLSNFRTPNVTSMGYMFEDSPKLESVDIRNFDTSNADIEAMFMSCWSLASLTVGAKTNLAPAGLNATFSGIGRNGIIRYPAGCDYSSWLYAPEEGLVSCYDWCPIEYYPAVVDGGTKVYWTGSPS